MRCAVPVQVVSCELRCRLPLRCGAAMRSAVRLYGVRCRGGVGGAAVAVTRMRGCALSLSLCGAPSAVPLSAEPRWGAVSCTECRCGGAVRCRCGECGAGGPLNAVRCGCSGRVL